MIICYRNCILLQGLHEISCGGGDREHQTAGECDAKGQKRIEKIGVNRLKQDGLADKSAERKRQPDAYV